jgi:ribonuclease I
LSWTPSEAQGPNTFEFQVLVSDGEESSAQTVRVQVEEQNQAPVVSEIADQTVVEGTELAFTVEASDADEPAQDLTYSLEGEPAGAVIDATTGVLSWTPSEAQGPDTFEFQVLVSDGEENSAQTARVQVEEQNQAPVVTEIADQTVVEGTELVFTVEASDADEPAQDLTYSLEGEPAGAVIDATTGVLSWTPSEAQGPNTFEFQVLLSDGEESSAQTVRVQVEEQN